MPFYDLVCPACNSKREVRCSYDEAKHTNCLDCEAIMEIAISQVSALWNCDCPTASGGKGIRVQGTAFEQEEIKITVKGDSDAPKAYEIECEACNISYEKFLKNNQEVTDTCPTCGMPMQKRIGAPIVRDSWDASFIDGTKREGFAEAREANKLKREMRNMRPEQQMEAQREISKIIRVRGS